MDFSSNVFRAPPSTSSLSEDTVSHTQLVMACRWGWGEASPTTTSTQTPPTIPPSAPTFSNNLRAKRFAACQGRIYHQLQCSHRIRTDIVEDCGTNCIEPFGNTTAEPFICKECIQKEASQVWDQRKAEFDASYPLLDQMTYDQYNQYYRERSQLRDAFMKESQMYERELLFSMRDSNICSALESNKEEVEFAAELDSLSLQMMGSNDNPDRTPVQQPARHRVSLPTDSSEQLHWGLNSLALDRGSCGVEYSASQPGAHMSPSATMDKDSLWRKPRD